MIVFVKAHKFYIEWRLTVSVSIVDEVLCVTLFQK